VIVRWGLGELGGLLGELGLERPLLITSERLARIDVPIVRRFAGVRRHSPVDTVAAATEAVAGADGLVAVGGGSAIDTGKAVSAAAGLPLVAVPTTYAGAEWTRFYGMRDEAQRRKSGGGGARVVAAVYEPQLTLDLPRDESVGTAMNALAHAAEALYAGPLEDASTGARLIGLHLPAVASDGHDLEARTGLLEGALHAGRALGERGLFLAHALAQGLGGRYGLAHGAMNALTLAPTLRFNASAVPEALAQLADALGADNAPSQVEELAALGRFGKLRDHGVPADDLPGLAAEIAERPGARANPRTASAADVEGLLREIW
jgi:alcohol dehydrogenase class IV